MAITNPSSADEPGPANASDTGKRHVTPQKTSTRPALRKLLLKIHLYIALGIGVLLVLASVTGSLLVYKQTLDKWLNPDLFHVVARGNYQSYHDLISAANKASPIQDTPHHIRLPEDKHAPLVVRYQTRHPDSENNERRFAEVMVNPYTGQVLGHRNREDALMATILQLHRNLLAGDTGKLIMGTTALLVLLLTTTGIYLWWPGKSRIKQAFTIKPKAGKQRFNYDLHRITGIYTIIILFSVALSGAYLNLLQIFKPAVGFFFPLTEIPRDLKSVASEGTPLTLEKVFGIVQTQFPDGISVRQLFLPARKESVYTVTGHQPFELTENGRTMVWVDQHSGKIINTRDPAQLGPGDTLNNLQLPLHNDEILGQTGRVLVLLTGFVPPVLIITGVRIWLRKRKSEKIESGRIRVRSI